MKALNQTYNFIKVSKKDKDLADFDMADRIVASSLNSTFSDPSLWLYFNSSLESWAVTHSPSFPALKYWEVLSNCNPYIKVDSLYYVLTDVTINRAYLVTNPSLLPQGPWAAEEHNLISHNGEFLLQNLPESPLFPVVEVASASANLAFDALLLICSLLF